MLCGFLAALCSLGLRPVLSWGKSFSPYRRTLGCNPMSLPWLLVLPSPLAALALRVAAYDPEPGHSYLAMLSSLALTRSRLRIIIAILHGLSRCSPLGSRS
eukprot:3931774-Rhodomonas_salina.1